MKRRFIILNGSPKGNNSITMQSIEFIKLKFKQHDFEYINISNSIKKYENNKDELVSLCEKIQYYDGVIWAFPVYHLLVPAQYKRFIELIFQNDCTKYFIGKYTCIFSTSIHYYDITAHEYMQEICSDLGMLFVDSLSHEMNDLLKENRQSDLTLFIKHFLFTIENNLKPLPNYSKIDKSNYLFYPNDIHSKISTTKKILIVTDAKNENTNLDNMISHYLNCFDKNNTNVEIINIRNMDFECCRGCCHCAKENICIFDQKDDYRKNLDRILKDSDILIYAGSIVDRYLSSIFKKYFDRTFCYNHIPMFKDKQIGFIISGNLSNNLNLKFILEVYAQHGSNLIGFVTDESYNNEMISKGIESFANLGVQYCETNYFRPCNFLGIGAQKLFRDAIFSDLGAIFIKDFKYYKEHEIFDYLNIKEKIKFAFRRYFFKKDKVREEIDKNMINLMVAPHKKLCAKIKSKDI